MSKLLPEELRSAAVRVFVVVIILWFACVALTFWLFDDSATRGQLGDLFGSVNALFSGLSMAGVIIALFYQAHEHRESQKEQQVTLNLMMAQTELMKHQTMAAIRSAEIQALTEVLKSTEEILQRAREARDEHQTNAFKRSVREQTMSAQAAIHMIGRDLNRAVQDIEKQRGECILRLQELLKLTRVDLEGIATSVAESQQAPAGFPPTPDNK